MTVEGLLLLLLWFSLHQESDGTFFSGFLLPFDKVSPYPKRTVREAVPPYRRVPEKGNNSSHFVCDLLMYYTIITTDAASGQWHTLARQHHVIIHSLPRFCELIAPPSHTRPEEEQSRQFLPILYHMAHGTKSQTSRSYVNIIMVLYE